DPHVADPGVEDVSLDDSAVLVDDREANVVELRIFRSPQVRVRHAQRRPEGHGAVRRDPVRRETEAPAPEAAGEGGPAGSGSDIGHGALDQELRRAAAAAELRLDEHVAKVEVPHAAEIDLA